MKTKVAIITSAIIVCAVAAVLFIFVFNKGEYEVKFDTAGGSTVETQTVKKSETLERPADPTKEGYVFDNWYLGDEIFDFNSEITKNMTLKAKWIETTSGDAGEKFVVSFDTAGGNKISSLSISNNGTVTKPTNPTRSGYKFVSWQLDGKDFNFSTKITKNITLTAKWEKVDSDTKPVTKPTTPTKPSTPSTVAVTGVTLSKSTLSLTVGASSTLAATVAPSNATNKTVTWASSNPSVATVNASGAVTAVSAGTATITVTASGKTATCTVTVTAPVVDPTNYSVEWVDVAESVAGQSTLYIKSPAGTRVAGKVRITTLTDKVIIVDIPASGKMYTKSTVKNATVYSVN